MALLCVVFSCVLSLSLTGVSDQVWYLIVLIPDFCHPLFFVLQTDVIVNITTSASTLSGTISEGLCLKAKAFDLNKEYKTEVKKGGPPADGAVVQTLAGGMSCNVVYHLKIDPKWPDYNGPAVSK